MTVSTIEALFALKSNLFQMFTGATIRATPVLCILSVMMTSMGVAVSFPPGAINVVSVQRTSYNPVVVPTFNASFMGNGSGYAANHYSLATLSPISESADGSVSGFTSRARKNSNLLYRLAFQTMITGQPFDQPSPCGVNCSFVIQFEGPTLECNSSSTKLIRSDSGNLSYRFPGITIYSGNWSDLTISSTSALPRVLYNGTDTNVHWQSTTLTILDAEESTADAGLLNETTTINRTMIQNDLYCTPGRALYAVNNTYVSNILKRNITTTPIAPLINLELPNQNNSIIVPGFTKNHGYGASPADWSAEAIAYYRDLNMMTILDTMFYYLAGRFVVDIERETDDTSDDGMGGGTPTFENVDAGTSGEAFD
ncbi:hypothetical protein DID88_002833 [Monilinia fructigena]|uniref:Uncharacterized protein n=1 Tax=Monilinia fructigena TaxID=38457 RepID=A0A395ITU2_9HELO|nr:hypothetical protein DID88_002833 [Monilinia fructigena]